MYDYLIVGAGLFGAVFAREAAETGKKCLVIDKRDHIGGNLYCERIEDINVHMYGPHIFHTNDKAIWDYINRFAQFNRYTNAPIADYKGELYNLPPNMNTFYKLWGTVKPEDAKKKIESQRKVIQNPKNLEEQAISLVGADVYEKLIKGYTEKQWGRKCEQLPVSIIKRLPVRFTYDNNYFNDRYQGIPLGGYNRIFEKLLKNCDISLNTEYSSGRPFNAKKTIYTGMIDEYFDYCYGALEYRSLRFETEVLDTDNYQGNAVVNYTSADVPYTRIIEHKHFEYGEQEKSIITREYPKEWQPGDEPFYPVNDEKNTERYKQYEELAIKEKNVKFGGRLGSYKYYDMWQVIQEALIEAKGITV